MARCLRLFCSTCSSINVRDTTCMLCTTGEVLVSCRSGKRIISKSVWSPVPLLVYMAALIRSAVAHTSSCIRSLLPCSFSAMLRVIHTVLCSLPVAVCCCCMLPYLQPKSKGSEVPPLKVLRARVVLRFSRLFFHRPQY